jgi:hypothetical protein
MQDRRQEIEGLVNSFWATLQPIVSRYRGMEQSDENVVQHFATRVPRERDTRESSRRLDRIQAARILASSSPVSSAKLTTWPITKLREHERTEELATELVRLTVPESILVRADRAIQ